jgi:hypothetical protein
MGALRDFVSILYWILHVIGICCAFVVADSHRQLLFVMSTCRSHAINPCVYNSILFCYSIDVKISKDHFKTR